MHYTGIYGFSLPKPCPLLDVCDPGNPNPGLTAPSGDLKSDLPKYCIVRDGVVTETVTNIEKYWRQDLVSFLLGCSFSWDHELETCGLIPRHMEQGVMVSAYRTSIPLEPCGPFTGNMVVSMRPYKTSEIHKVAEITSSYPAAHGSPVHIGDPEKIGIKNADNGKMPKPDYGSPVDMRDGELPLFWACGITPLVVLANAKLPFAITHCPCRMFVTDILCEELRI